MYNVFYMVCKIVLYTVVQIYTNGIAHVRWHPVTHEPPLRANISFVNFKLPNDIRDGDEEMKLLYAGKHAHPMVLISTAVVFM